MRTSSATSTFLFTDVEGSTRWWALDVAAMSASLIVHDGVLREAIESNGGYVFTTAGDSFAAAFGSAASGLAAASAIQARLASAAWPGPVLRVRIGLHLGDAEERDGDYFGPAVNIAARVQAAAHGGQILITDAVRVAARAEGVTDLGEHRLRDVDELVRLFQLGGERFPAVRTEVRPVSNLPARPTRLIGRARVIEAIREELAEHRLVTMTAVGGSGKTRLAIAVGEAELDQRADGVWFVDLTSTMIDEDVPGLIAGALGLQLTTADPLAQVVSYLASKRSLLILDNCEQVVAGCAAFVDALLSAPGETVVLATSREALDVDGERVVRVPPLSSAVDSADEESPAVQLFVERAASVGVRFTLDDTVRETIASVCERLDGIPLAIELAAGRTTVLSLPELLGGLDDRFALFGHERRGRRARTLEATLDWSYELLDSLQQRVFRALAVFVGGFDLDAVAAVAGLDRSLTIDTVGALVAKSMVVRADGVGTSRFTLLETLRAYAHRQLVDAGEDSVARDRHAAHFHQLSTALGRRCTADVRIGDRLSDDRSNLSAGFDWLAHTDRWVTAGEILLGSLAAYDGYGHGLEARAMYKRCIGPIDSIDPDLGCFLRTAMALPLMTLDDWHEIGDLANVLSNSTDPMHQASGRLHLAFVFAAAAAPDTAIEMIRLAGQSLELAPAGVNKDLITAMLLGMTGTLALWTSDIAGAREALRARLDNLARHDHISSLDLAFNQTEAMCELMQGNVTRTFELIDWGDSFTYPNGKLREIRALAHLASGDRWTATEHVRAHAEDALTGRLSRLANDTVLLLAALSEHERDSNRAVELLMQMGPGRTPATIAYSTNLARRLEVSQEFALAQASAMTDLTGANEDDRVRSGPMTALRNEVDRRGWARR